MQDWEIREIRCNIMSKSMHLVLHHHVDPLRRLAGEIVKQPGKPALLGWPRRVKSHRTASCVRGARARGEGARASVRPNQRGRRDGILFAMRERRRGTVAAPCKEVGAGTHCAQHVGA